MIRNGSPVSFFYSPNDAYGNFRIDLPNYKEQVRLRRDGVKLRVRFAVSNWRAVLRR